jgi:formate-dependent nitrite reductase membrane component NrfD
MSTSTALITLVLHIFRAPASVLHKLDRLEWAALLLEMTGLLAFLRGSGRAARPLVGTGPKEQGAQFWGLVLGSGLALPWLVKTFSLFGRKSHNSVISALPSLLVIVGGYFLRRTLVKAGHTSSQDARTTLWHAKR